MKKDSLSAKDWLAKANEDMEIAEDLYNRNKFFGDVCFHAQQSAEKSLKAFLVYHRIVPEKTHNLSMLGEECFKIDNPLKEITVHLDNLNELYIPTRYPFKVEFTREQAKEAIKSAKIVLEKIKTKIG